MPVRKFRDARDMPDASYVDKNHPRWVERIAALWTFSSQLTGDLPIARGVYRFRTIEELNAHHLEWDRRRIEALQERRRGERPT